MTTAASKQSAGRPRWFGSGLRFECTQCGNCCSGPQGYVRFTDEEARAIAAHLRISLEQFEQSFTKTVGGEPSLSEFYNAPHGYDCVFLRREGGRAMCSIYEVRPLQCRAWPFWPENLRRRADWQRAAENCPGMNHGRLYSPDEIGIIRDGHAER